MSFKVDKEYRRLKIKKRVRKTITGSGERPRMTVFRSNKDIYVQLIDDQSGTTLAAASSRAKGCLLYTSPSPRDRTRSRMPSSA